MDYLKNLNLSEEINWKRLDETVRKLLGNEKSGHDYDHAIRVVKNALEIANNYELDYNILIAACLLHDIAFKNGFVKDHHIVGSKDCKEILVAINFPLDKIQKVAIAIEDHVGHTQTPIRKNEKLQIESKILRDADNIDALGAIGLIRVISFCSSQKIPLHKSDTDGFNESLFGNVKEIITWADKMITPEGKAIGLKRTEIMKDFLKQFKEENL